MKPFSLFVAAALLLAGCAKAVDLKPGVIRGVDKRGFVETTDGYGIAVRGCSDEELWATILETAKTLRPSAHIPLSGDTSFGPLRILDADPTRGIIRAQDPRTFWRPGTYVGIFIHRLKDDIKMIEVSALWDAKTTMLTNPWEGNLLHAFRERLTCVVPSEHATPPITGRARILMLPAGGAIVTVPPLSLRPWSPLKRLAHRSRDEVEPS